MRTQSYLRFSTRSALLLTAAALPLPALADLTWNSAGASNDWSTAAANWLPGNVVWAQNENAIFNAAPETVNVITANTVFNDITFDIGGFTIANGAGSFTLANDLASTITVTNAADTATIVETIANNTGGLSSLTKAGAGTLVLSGVNTYTGQTLVTAGTLRLGNGAATGAGGAAAETIVSSGATVDLNNQAVTNTEIFRIAGTGVGNGGAMINTGADQLNSINRLELTADATIGGVGRFDIRPGATPKLDLAGNTLTKIDGNQVSLVGAEVTSGNIVINGGIFSIETTTAVGGTGTITINNGGSLGVWGNISPNVTRPIEANAGAQFYNLNNASSIDSNITLNGPVTFLGGANQTYLGVISGTGSINKTGTFLTLGGTLAGGANTFTGATIATGGTLALDYSNSDTSKLADGAPLTLNNTTLQMSGTSGSHAEVVGPVTINGVSTIAASGENLATIALGNYVTNGLLNVQLGDLATTTKLNNAQGYLPHTLFQGVGFAANNGTGKIVAASDVTYVDVTNLSSGTKSIPSATGSIVRTIEGSGTAGNILLGAATTDIQTMLHTAITATTVDFGGQTLRLAANGELISGGGSSVVTLQNGSLTAGGAADTAGNIFLANAGTNAPVVSAKITNNGTGAVSLTTAGNVTLGNTATASTNDYSGGTTVTGGTLTVASAVAAGAKSGLGTGAVTVNPGGNLRILTGSTANAQSYANDITLNDATLTSEDGVVTYGGTITLNGTNTINAYYADNKNAVFSNATNSITGTGNLVATGTSIILNGVNTYTGTTRAAAGNLQFGKQVSFYNNTPSSWTATNLIVNAGVTATFAVGGAGEFTSADLDAIKLLGTSAGGFLRGSNFGISTTNAGGSFTYATPIANPNNGINTLGVSKRGTGTLVLTGAHTYTGTTGVIQGVLDITGSLTAGSALSTAGGTTLQITGAAILGGGTHTAAIANAGTLRHASSANQSFSGIISGAGAFLKDTSTTSSVTFTANNTYTGATTVNAGTLTLSGEHRTSSGFNVGPGATLSTTTNNIFTANHTTAMDNARLFSVNGGTLLFPNSGDNRIGNVTLRNGATWTSNRTLAAWDYLLANTSTGAATVKVENTGGSTAPSVMNGTGGIHLQGVQNFDVANVTVSAATDLTVSMVLGAQGTAGGAVGGINKTGTGTMTLAATNTYTGATTVTVGTLLINGSTNALSAASVSTDATLGGTGTVNGAVTVAAGGLIAPGANTVGTLTTGAATIDGIYACEINGATADKLAVTGNLDIDGASLNVSILSAPTQPEYIIATYTGTRTGTFTGLAEGATATPGYIITYATAGQIKLVTAPSGPSYTTWAATFSPNPGAAGVDYELDTYDNGMEFVLGGSPVSGSNNPKVYSFAADSEDGDTDKEMIMTIAVPVGTPAFVAGAPATSSVAGFGIAVYGSTTLSSFPLTVTPVAPIVTGLPPAPFVQGGVSYEYRSFSLSGSNGLADKGFLRVKVTNP